MDSRCLHSRLHSSLSSSNLLPNHNTRSIFKSLNPDTNWKYIAWIRWHANKHTIITDSSRLSISLIQKDMIAISISRFHMDGTKTNADYLFGLSFVTLKLLVTLLSIINLFGSSSVRSSRKNLSYLSISIWVFLKNLVVYIGIRKKIKFLLQPSSILFLSHSKYPKGEWN